MTMRLVLPIVLAFAGVSAAASAQDNVSAAVVSWKADKMEQPSEGVLAATGHVTLGLGSGLQVRADSVAARKNTTGGEQSVKITAIGNVVLIRGDERFRFDRLVLDSGTGRGSFGIFTASQ